ncbi:MAG: division/cell wall cluster transcriptional repressor MraZ [Parcubacteria group bacterium]|nr:division/cell wall cluster transcriptional repressor MraZ [Parcubacteria group bacterium]
MLIGEYRHSIDAKKRLSLPAKFRKEIGGQVVVTRGFDTCLYIYPLKEWSRVTEKLRGLSMGQRDQRGVNRFMLGGAVEADVDALGRILVPDFLKTFARLSNKVVLVGVNDHVEIWDEKTWNAYRTRIEKKADELAEKLGEIGAI